MYLPLLRVKPYKMLQIQLKMEVEFFTFLEIILVTV